MGTTLPIDSNLTKRVEIVYKRYRARGGGTDTQNYAGFLTYLLLMCYAISYFAFFLITVENKMYCSSKLFSNQYKVS